MTSTEIAVRENGHAAVAERDIIDGWVTMAADVFKLATHICDTDFVPEAYRGSAPAVAAAILAGRELGIGPMTSLRHVQIVKGVPTLSAEYKRARVLAAGHEFDILELNTQRCRVSGRRQGSVKPPYEAQFTMEDAKRAGLLNPSRSGKPGAWQTRPRRMLFARAGSELCDFLFADVVNGLPTAELVADGTENDEFAGYDEAPANGQQKSRTAQRKPRTQTAAAEAAAPSPAPPAAGMAPHSAAGQTPDAPSTAERAGEAPPLPDEIDPAPAVPETTAPAAGAVPDDTDWDTPGTVTEPMLRAIWTVLGKVYAFTADEKDTARKVCAHIAGHDLETSSNLSYNEAKAVLDTLGNWQAVAREHKTEPRKFLDTILNDAAGEAPGE